MSRNKPDKVFSVALADGDGVAYAIARHGKGAKGVISAAGLKPSLTLRAREVGEDMCKQAVNFKPDEKQVV